MNAKKIKICRVVQIPLAFHLLLKDQIDTIIKEKVYEVHLICSDGDEAMRSWKGAHFHPVWITRKVSPWKDLSALLALYKYFRKNRIQVVHSVTQKAGLLCAIASWMARVPVRMHTFVGQSWLELSGFLKWILILGDWLIVKLNTQCLADSQSQIDLMASYHICHQDDIKVLGPGSIAGVNLEQFAPDRWLNRKEEIRAKLRIPRNSFVITFVGRLTSEKGIVELVEALDLLLAQKYNLLLILVGPFQTERLPLSPDMIGRMKNHPFIRLIGYTIEPEKYLSISDLFCLPSYREGFGGAIIEAGAMALPTVASKVVGIVDAVVDGETGLLVPPRDPLALANAIFSLLNNKPRRLKMGMAARHRAVAHFNAKEVNGALLREYKRILTDKAIWDSDTGCQETL